MDKIFAERMKSLGTETAFEVLAKAKALERQGRKIVHLEIGEPDFDTPQNIKDAAVKALNEGYTHYVAAAGIPELREAIAQHISETRNIDVDPEEVVVTPGAKQMIFIGILACVNKGDEVMYPNPGYPIYESLINFLGAKPVPLPLKEENNFKLSPSDIVEKITDKTKMIVLNFPENPTGGVLDRDDLRAIGDAVARRDDLLIVSDEIYSRILYEGRHESIASIPNMKDRTLIVDGFSKTYAMTGWRLGYGVMRKELAQKASKLVINTNSCTCSFVQKAGVEALNGPQEEVRKMVNEFKNRRDAIVSGLNNIEGISCKKPLGTFYVFPNIRELGMKSKEVSSLILNKAGVAILPGTAFGSYGEGHLRFSFANSIENIQKALTQISDAL